jgi:hypothetical protein
MNSAMSADPIKSITPIPNFDRANECGANASDSIEEPTGISRTDKLPSRESLLNDLIEVSGFIDEREAHISKLIKATPL